MIKVWNPSAPALRCVVLIGLSQNTKKSAAKCQYLHESAWAATGNGACFRTSGGAVRGGGEAGEECCVRNG